MKNLARSLALAVAAASSLAASPARACDDDHRAPAPPAAYPAPADGRWDDGWDGPAGRDGRWRDGGWRHRALARIDAELAALDRDRAAFLARWGWHPRKVARYEARYSARRAELERRRAELTYYARAGWR